MQNINPFKKKLFIIILLVFTACNENLIHNLTENDANKIISGLHKHLISAKKIKQADGFWSISVPKTSSYKALEFLTNTRIVKTKPINNQSSSGLISSREEKLFKFERALSNEIEYTLKSLPGVLDVRVHLNLPVKDPLFGQNLELENTGSASVLLISNSQFISSKEAVQKLIAGASGISTKNVSILIQQSDFLEIKNILPIELKTNNFNSNFITNNQIQILSSIIILFIFTLLFKYRNKKLKIKNLKSLHSTKDITV